jgi:hypothetical protein
MKIDRIGALHFEVWSTEGNELLLGSGNYKIKRKLRWKKTDHLNIIDGIRTKAYFKETNMLPMETYLSFYYGEPIIIQLLKNENEIVVSLSNK